MARADVSRIASYLRDIGSALELGGERGYRAAAYTRGARVLESTARDVDDLIATGELTDLPGIGPALAAQITEIHATGRSDLRERLLSELPEGAIELASVGLSLRAVRALTSQLGVRSVDALRVACEAGRVRSLPGFGVKRETKILAAIAAIATEPTDRALLLVEAREIANAVMAHLRRSKSIALLASVGSLRRGCELVDVVELLAVAERPDDALDRFARMANVRTALRTELDCEAELATGARVTLHAAVPAASAAALQRWTGPASHNAAVDRAAARCGLSIEPSGVFSASDRAPRGDRAALPVDDEHELYRLVGLHYVPPEVRDVETGEDAVPPLIEARDVRGLVHCHTDYSDGRHTIEQMARAAATMGMEYITITDHSPSAHYAGGVDLERLARQWDEIARVQDLVGIRVLRGTESDILADGALDYPDAVLEKLDVVIASIHHRHALDAKRMTTRIVRAMRHPLFKIWGHALGRLLLRRPPIECDVDAIFEAMTESRAAIELNGDPHRMDASPVLARRAHRLGIGVVVSVDAHSVRDFRNLEIGVTMARRAGLTRDDVLNTRGAEGFAQAVHPLRQR